MCSKLYGSVSTLLVTRMPSLTPAPAQLRTISFGFPKQYKQPVSENFRSLFHILRNRWELTPLLACIIFDFFLVFGATYNSFKNKVDIQLTGHNWNCISRRMDLREPTVHKLLVYNQQYEPWPEVQHVLDKMAEKEAKPCALRRQSSSF